jgi:S-adenosyl-L-methionine hydrolase (adenosine-forming)
MSPGPRPIVFLSDYGLDDDFVGICHAVMAGISPRSNVIDLSHAVPPQDVLRGALALHRSLPFLPTDAVVLAVVDPGVGTPRLPVAVETARHGRLLVGPDNGLLSLAWLQEQGVRSAVEIASPAARLEPVSTTFHGRDIFAPAAAHLAGGMALKELGPPVDPRSLVALALPKAGVEPGEVAAEVLAVDRFGNLQLSGRVEDLHSAGMEGLQRLDLVAGGRSIPLRRAATFGDVPEGALGLIVDSSGWLAVVLNRGSAAEMAALGAGDAVTLRRPVSS